MSDTERLEPAYTLPYLPHRFFYLASIPVLVAAVIYGLRYMPSRRSSWAVKLDVGLAWFSALSVLVLVPTDVASTLQVRSCTCISHGGFLFSA